jgi:pimeloyl-ACP methyl ester carboxylesterase
VVLLHGWASTSYMWRFVMPQLVARGHTVLAPDLRGLGDTTKPATGYDKATGRLPAKGDQPGGIGPGNHRRLYFRWLDDRICNQLHHRGVSLGVFGGTDRGGRQRCGSGRPGEFDNRGDFSGPLCPQRILRPPSPLPDWLHLGAPAFPRALAGETVFTAFQGAFGQLWEASEFSGHILVWRRDRRAGTQ